MAAFVLIVGVGRRLPTLRSRLGSWPRPNRVELVTEDCRQWRFERNPESSGTVRDGMVNATFVID